jgi:DNA repair protein RadC
MDDQSHFLGHRQRLRERFLSTPSDAIPDYELLEIILFAAKPRGDVKPLAKRLLKVFGGLDKVINAEDNTLRQVHEVGDSVVAALKASRLSAQRMLKSTLQDKPVIQTWSALMDYCRLKIGHKKVEEFHVLFLNHKHILITDEIMQRGTINHATIYPREVIKRAFELGASALILLHNHPSGDPTPSTSDIQVTKKIVDAAKAVNIVVHDHVIITEHGNYSFKSFGLIE